MQCVFVLDILKRAVQKDGKEETANFQWIFWVTLLFSAFILRMAVILTSVFIQKLWMCFCLHIQNASHEVSKLNFSRCGIVEA
jgi:hypothetical protein